MYSVCILVVIKETNIFIFVTVNINMLIILTLKHLK